LTKLCFFLGAILLTATPARAEKGANSFSVGIGLGLTHVSQQIPGIPAAPANNGTQLSYLNLALKTIWAKNLAVTFSGGALSEMFTVDGAARTPDGDVTVFDGSVEGSWSLTGGAVASPKNFEPFAIVGLAYSGLPVIGMPEAAGRVFTLQRADYLAPMVGVGTGIYLSDKSFTASARLAPLFSGGTRFTIENGYSFQARIGYDFVVKSLGNLGIELWGKHVSANFDQVDPVTRGSFNSLYSDGAWGIKWYYRLLF